MSRRRDTESTSGRNAASREKLRELEKAVSQESLSETSIHEAGRLRDFLHESLTNKRDRKRLARAQTKLAALVHSYYFPAELAKTEHSEIEDVKPVMDEGQEEDPSLGLLRYLATTNDSAASTQRGGNYSELVGGFGSGLPADFENGATDKLRLGVEPRATYAFRWFWDRHQEERVASEFVLWKDVASALRLEVHHSKGLRVKVSHLKVFVDNEQISDDDLPRPTIEPGADRVSLFLQAPHKALIKAAGKRFKKVAALAYAQVDSRPVLLWCWIEIIWVRPGWFREHRASLTFQGNGLQEVQA